MYVLYFIKHDGDTTKTLCVTIMQAPMMAESHRLISISSESVWIVPGTMTGDE